MHGTMMTDKKIFYDQEFYHQRNANTIYAARRILDISLSKIPNISSAIDVGCGVGTWLSVLAEKGVAVHGIDGPWVPLQLLQIPQQCFQPIDLEQAFLSDAAPIPVAKADFLITLEVAEHIPPTLADQFIKFIASKADYILFSAAIPGQTGNGHVNEQWPSYWSKKFENYNFKMIDIIRNRIWRDKKIPFWYRQNCFLVAKNNATIESFPSSTLNVSSGAADIVHPEQLFMYTSEKPSEAGKSIFSKIKRNLLNK